MDLSVANSAVWNDDAVQRALESASFWVKDLPFVKSLSGYWNFLLASSPEAVPKNFYEGAFQDSDWETLPGKICLCACFKFLIFIFSPWVC